MYGHFVWSLEETRRVYNLLSSEGKVANCFETSFSPTRGEPRASPAALAAELFNPSIPISL